MDTPSIVTVNKTHTAGSPLVVTLARTPALKVENTDISHYLKAKVSSSGATWVTIPPDTEYIFRDDSADIASISFYHEGTYQFQGKADDPLQLALCQQLPVLTVRMSPTV